MITLTDAQVAAFWAKVEKSEVGCWFWAGSSSAPPHHDARYGTFRVGDKTLKAHRVAYALCVRQPGPLSVLHLCDNSMCVRPDHLVSGTHAENMRDMRVKGRDGGPPAQNRAKDECDQGHPLSGVNLYVRSNGQRQCKACRRAASRRYEDRKRKAAAA